MNRVLRAATIGVLVLSPAVLSACSAGQIAQTATQERDIRGGQADLGSIHLRTATTAYPQSGVYEEGGDARLLVAIANSGTSDDELTDISGPGFESYEVVDPTASGDASPTGFTIPAGSNVYVGDGGPQVTLTGLTEALTPAQSLEVTFTFRDAGEVTLPVLVGTPSLDLPRGEQFDFHDEGGAAEG
ncbi:copper chaperone PCu(A)C [Klenkia sp. PcliD-1-E]|uniref:copper chaperone PCu(A)C n=1 Tax=Klenkia sp. PcliD-1-E TaxID=2954492 RepID=UPI0020976D6E|nr:copper chaperone PCu(A)C [Klenkia sp. PcliD-1-E]MCO7219917.1 copper chaperone PCu(A)C [Klenkia sp. PcliD-1-E]